MSRKSLWRVLHPVLGLALMAVAAVVLLGRRGELSGTAASFRHIDTGWMVLAVLAEAVSMLCFALMTGRLLGEAHHPLRLGPLLGITLAGNAVTNSLPAGPAFGLAYAYRRYREREVPEIVSAWVILAGTVLTTAALALLAAVGVVSALGQGTAFDLVGVTTGVLIVTWLLLAVLRRPTVLAGPGRLVLALARATIHRPRRPPEVVMAGWQERLAVVTPGWSGLWVSLGWSLGNWVLDLACLACAFGAVDAPVPWRGLLLAYGAAQLAANLPITPGGLGVVEGSLTIGLVAYGGAQASSVAAVLVYRIMSFWALLVIGWGVAGILALVSRRLREAATAGQASEMVR
jgi:uncharacterized protein (TIRG00374 family)